MTSGAFAARLEDGHVQEHTDTLQFRAARQRRGDPRRVAAVRAQDQRLQRALEVERGGVPAVGGGRVPDRPPAGGHPRHDRAPEGSGHRGRPCQGARGGSVRRQMRAVVAKWAGAAPQLLSVLRIVAAAIFIQTGTMKLFAFPIGLPPDGAAASFPSQVWIGGVLEVFGGLLLLLGLFTRPFASVLSGEMAVAYFQFHFPHGFWPVVNQGTSAAIYCFVWLYFSAAGAGPWSLDAWRRS